MTRPELEPTLFPGSLFFPSSLSLSSQKEGKKRDLKSKVGLEPEPLHLESSARII